MRVRQQIGQIKIAARRHLNDDRLLLALPKRGVGAEVGVWKGDHAAAILRWARPRKLLLIDPWEHRPELAGAVYGGLAKGGQEQLEAVYQSVLERFDGQLATGQVEVLRARSTDVELAPESLDWVYIDGDHSYEAVKADLEHFARIVRRGGCLAGDDYLGGTWFRGQPQRAVDEFAQTPACKKVDIIGSKFLIELA
jgi:hypothetical protein